MPSCQIFTAEQIDSLRKGGKILRATLEHTASLVKPGVTTAELDKAAEEFIRSHDGAEPGFKGYHGFPATLCTSVNDECVHGMPGERVLKEGDIIAIDCGVLLDGLYTDACVTVPVGQISESVQKFLDMSKQALNEGVGAVAAGVRVGDISATIQEFVESRGHKCMQSLTGHGLGDTLHQFPDVPNQGRRGTGAELPLHTLIAIEPITTCGSDQIRTGKDGWTLSTKDGALSAHFEHTVLTTEEGCEIIA